MNKLTNEQVEQQNLVLEQSSKDLFGDEAVLRILAPKGIQLRRENARYMKRDVFRQLVENVRGDDRLSSVPLCFENRDGRVEVLSGNHRVKAAVEAGLEWIMVMVLLGDVAEGRQIAIQLSHNAIVGEDDESILASLWQKIDDVKDRLYSGLTSEQVGDIPEIELVNFSTPSITTRTMMFAFTPHELERLDEVLQELSALPAANMTYLAPAELYEPFFTGIQRVKQRDNIKDGSLALAQLLGIIESEEAGE